ncbi:hypothetical protein [Polyangium sp. 6x1]|uniref:hypothetical protein n=1 Tax=Polyangium sp. 6x1 TaxID=3042689 RepID=UPI002482E0D4|nr:hypothetical protein [Polyangium sp. 6x1]MDI1445397.1 hypothetical protein [Polyangium sp. 6x1]
MKRGFLACGGALVGLWLLAGPSGAPAAHAEEATAAAEPTVTAPTCSIKGTYPPSKNTKLFDAPSGGNHVATLNGAYIPMTLTEIPFDPTVGRARLATSAGSGAMRLEGYVAPADISLFTTRDISVYGGHVWIASAQKVKLVKASQSSLTVEIPVGGTLNQTVRATAPCDAFALAKGTVQPFEIPGNGRGYMTKKQKIELFDKPNGDVVLALDMMEGAGQLFWSTEMKLGFVHVMSRSDLTIDAWARLRDLDALKKGEMMDQYVPPTTQIAGAQLTFDKPPPLARVTKEIPIRAKRDDKAKPIGVIEADTEVYVLETVAGWTNVLPKHLGIVPPDDGGFWIPSSEVPK